MLFDERSTDAILAVLMKPSLLWKYDSAVAVTRLISRRISAKRLLKQFFFKTLACIKDVDRSRITVLLVLSQPRKRCTTLTADLSHTPRRESFIASDIDIYIERERERD
jgi:hypothetical protein